MLIIEYSLAVAAFTLLFATLLHYLYKKLHHKKRYEGITVWEGIVIYIGTVPGVFGCVSGTTGFGFPLPFFIGSFLDLLFLGNSSCGWEQALLFDDPYLSSKFIGFTVAWGVTNLIYILILYIRKRKKRPV